MVMSAYFNGEMPATSGSNSGSSLSLSLRMTSSARSRDRISWTWLASAASSARPGSPAVRLTSGRRKMFSRPSYRMVADDLYFGVTTSTATAVRMATITAGRMIARLRRHSARPSDRTSSSPAGSLGGVATGAAGGGVFGATAGVRSTVAAATFADLRLNNITDSDSGTTQNAATSLPRAD